MDYRLLGSSLWGLSRQEHWSGLPCPPPGDLPNPGIKPRSPTLQADSLPTEPRGKPKSPGVGSLSHFLLHPPYLLILSFHGRSSKLPSFVQSSLLLLASAHIISHLSVAIIHELLYLPPGQLTLALFSYIFTAEWSFWTAGLPKLLHYSTQTLQGSHRHKQSKLLWLASEVLYDLIPTVLSLAQACSVLC